MAVLVKNLNGLAYASVKSKLGLAVASIKSINGLDVTAGGGGGSPTLIVSTIKGTNSSSVTTDAIDTTGANFIAIVLSSGGGSSATISDSKSNTWTNLTLYVDVFRSISMSYCYAPTVGSGHTFTGSLAGKNSIAVAAFNNVATSPFDVENGNVGTTFGTNTPLSTGSVTPSQANSLLIAGLMGDSGLSADMSIDSSFTIANSLKGSDISGGGYSCALAYKVLTSSSATNPSWTFSANPAVAAANIAAFKY